LHEIISAPLYTKENVNQPKYSRARYLLVLASILIVGALAYGARFPIIHLYLMLSDDIYRSSRIAGRPDQTIHESIANGLIAYGCKGSMDGVKLLVRLGVNAEEWKEMVPAFMCAVESGNTELVIYFLELGVDVNATWQRSSERPTTMPSTALQRAVDAGNVPLIELLLQKGADPNRTATDMPGAVHFAARENKLDIVRRLIKAGGKADTAIPEPPIFLFVQDIASRRPQLDFDWKPSLTAAVKAGLTLNAKDPFGRTVLHWAANHGQYTLIQALLSMGISSYDEDAQGALPFTHLLRWIENSNIEKPRPEELTALASLTKGVQDINLRAHASSNKPPKFWWLSIEPGFSISVLAVNYAWLRDTFGERIDYSRLTGDSYPNRWSFHNAETASRLVNDLSTHQLRAAPGLPEALRREGMHELAALVDRRTAGSK
jgi:ankyrin repeat protein